MSELYRTLHDSWITRSSRNWEFKNHFQSLTTKKPHKKQTGIKIQQPLLIGKLQTIEKIFSNLFAAFQSKQIKFFLSKYVTIYRSILKLSYIDRYMILNIDRYMKFFKNHFSTDICRNFHFLTDIWKFLFFSKSLFLASIALLGS